MLFDLSVRTVIFSTIISLLANCGVDMSVNEENTISPKPTALPESNESNDLQSLLIVVKGLESSKGKLCYSIFSENRKALFGRTDVTPEDASFFECIKLTNTSPLKISPPLLPIGSYAISIFHDVNSNENLDTISIIGLKVPREPVGFSLNPPLTKPSAPGFEECNFKLTIKKAETLYINLKRIVTL